MKCYLCGGEHGYAQCTRPLGPSEIDAAVERASKGPRDSTIPVAQHLKVRTKEGVVQAIKDARKAFYETWKKQGRWRTAANQVARIRAIDGYEYVDDVNDDVDDATLELVFTMQEVELSEELFHSE